MELLAILSTIILVGTVATLILAVAAYVLYKVRERRYRRLRHTLDERSLHRGQPVLPVEPVRSAPRVPMSTVYTPTGADPVIPPAEAARYVPPPHLQTDDERERLQAARTSTHRPSPLQSTGNGASGSHIDGISWL